MSKWIVVGLAVALLLVIAIAVIAVLIGPVARWLAGEQGKLSDKEFTDVQASTRDTLLKAAAGIILLLGTIGTVGTLFYTAQTARSDQRQAAAAQSEAVTAQDSQVTDRYATAIDQLGANKMEERIGGIYALGGVMHNSPQDQPTVIDVLTAFVRDGPPRSDNSNPPPDIQAALTVIAYRNPKWDRGRINLYNAYLYNAEMNYAHLAGAELGGGNMGGIQLVGAHLHKADLGSADLSGSDLNHADLTDAYLNDHANLSGAALIGADLQGANLSGANLSGANLRGADLQDTRGLTKSQLVGAELNDKTKLPRGL
jgi:hypothetical protein